MAPERMTRLSPEEMTHPAGAGDVRRSPSWSTITRSRMPPKGYTTTVAELLAAARRIAAAAAREQGLPEKVEDPKTLLRIVRLMRLDDPVRRDEDG